MHPVVIKEEGWEAFEEHVSSAQLSDEPHPGVCDDPDYQVRFFYFFVSLYRNVWPFCAHKGKEPLTMLC